MPELRKDPCTNRWVIIATERGKRPSDFKIQKETKKGKEGCFFCPGNEQMTPPELTVYRNPGTQPNSPGWWIRVVPNKFPALQSKGELVRTGVGMYDMCNGIGAHEVIIETPDHDADMAKMSEKQVEEVLWAYRDRYLYLKRDSRLRYILIFKNHGRAAGASLEHPHSQLIATPIVPKRVMEELEASRQYYNYKERCVFCDILRQEISSAERIVMENNSFISFEPYASRFPYETWIVPKKHDASYEYIDKTQIMDLAIVLKGTLAKISGTLEDPPFNYVLHTSPISDSSKSFYHWHIEIMPRLTHVAGFEWGTGMYINPCVPEDTAKTLREAFI